MKKKDIKTCKAPEPWDREPITTIQPQEDPSSCGLCEEECGGDFPLDEGTYNWHDFFLEEDNNVYDETYSPKCAGYVSND